MTIEIKRLLSVPDMKVKMDKVELDAEGIRIFHPLIWGMTEVGFDSEDTTLYEMIKAERWSDLYARKSMDQMRLELACQFISQHCTVADEHEAFIEEVLEL